MTKHCQACQQGATFDTPFTMAFQPIIDLKTGLIFAHEALVRGANGESAGSILSAVDAANRYAFDQACRVKAIELATTLNLAERGANLSINFLPNAVYEPRACIRLTLSTAMRTGFPIENIIFEFTEDEKIDTAHLLNILRTYRAMGFKTAIDDFGAGHAGLSLLALFQPDIIKVDMALVRGIDTDRVKQHIVKHMVRLLDDLQIMTICEGVETLDELQALRDLGVTLIQGYVFAKPSFESLAPLPSIQNPLWSAPRSRTGVGG